MVHGRFGVSLAGSSGVAVCDAGGTTSFVTGSFLPPHANVMHRFLGTTGAAGSAFGEPLMLPPITGSLFWVFVVGGAEGAAGLVGPMDLFDSEKGAKFVNIPLGGGGLGVLVREGLVSPSLVSSAVDAKLVLLIIDRRRDKSGLTCTPVFEVVVSVVFNANVSRDCFRSDWAGTVDFWNSGCCCA
jgi:hypothetical protein